MARRGVPVWAQAILILVGVAGFAIASDEPSPTARRNAQREAWLRFHHAHPALATAIEGNVTTALATRVALREVIQACATTNRSNVLRDLPVSSAIEVDGRAIASHAWRCDTAPSDVAASQICSCVVARLPDALHLMVPPQIADDDLASYEGQLALNLPMAR
jgi:hypothetical protein